MDILHSTPTTPRRPPPMTHELAEAIEIGAAMLRERRFFPLERALAEEMA